MKMMTGWWLVPVLVLLTTSPAGAAAIPDESTLHTDVLTVMGTDSSTQPLAAFDDVELEDNARVLLRSTDRILLRLPPGRDARAQVTLSPVPPRYDDMAALNARIFKPMREYNTLRNIFILMFMAQD